jgi:hypothetical protein
MKLAMLVAGSTAAAAMALTLAATAHAGGGRSGPPDISFNTPSGNIGCTLSANQHGAAYCEIRDHVWASPVSDYTGKSCDVTFGGLEFLLKPGDPSKAGCYQGVSMLDYPGVETLDYGQTRTMGTVTCASEQTGLVCTDSGTGHVLRLSSESYELG